MERVEQSATADLDVESTAEVRQRRFLAVAPWPHALGETVILAAVFVALSFLAPGHGPAITSWLTAMLLIGPAGGALWLALRLRLPEKQWYRALPGEAALGLGLALAPSIILGFQLRQFAARTPQHVSEYLTADIIISLIFALAFVVYRMGVRLWLWWDGMRRRRLQWALTHALLLVAAVVAAAVSLVTMGTLLVVTARPMLQWLTALIFFTALSIVGVLVLLPPSALFSYLFAHGASRRVLSLVEATERLRGGDYSVRAAVEGEDEVAQLQANFNAMAADLERGVRELRAERDQVARLLQQRRELVANVSHELRTPVATMRGYLESATMRWDATSAETLRHDLVVMLHESERLQQLLDDLFTLSQAEVGRLALRCEGVDVGALTRRVVETVAPLAWRAGRVDVVARVDPETPHAWADPARVEQALHNLLRNAIRHTPPGGIIVVAARSTPDAPDHVALQVTDTGGGIAPDDLPRVWERFYRAESSREADATGGAGLGLALVREVIEAMGGAVAVESAPGEGSAFTLLLPVALDISRQETSPMPAASNF